MNSTKLNKASKVKPGIKLVKTKPRGKKKRRASKLKWVIILALIGLVTWLGHFLTKKHYPQIGSTWKNSLGMKFVPVPGTKVLFGIWDVRVQDFDAFVKASGYDATGGMYSYRSNNKLSQQCGDTWANPGFNQELTCPVVGVSWEDAKAFCEWLTRKERGDGTIKENQAYRLPLVAEWDQAVGLTKYPWGASWPPPSGAGNYAGSDLADADWNSDWETIGGYRDGFARTSPVGSFRANQFGLYDMSGNVRQLCEDMYLVRGKNAQMFQRSLRGASWIDYDPEILKSAYNHLQRSDFRMNIIGFRCVLAPDTLQSPAPSIIIVDIK